MTQTPENSLENCEAVMVGFTTRRFLIVRHDEPSHLPLAAGGQKRIRELQPGDEVIYKGQLKTVRSLTVYE